MIAGPQSVYDAARRRRYPLGTAGAEWDLLTSLLSAAACTVAGGHPELRPRREIVDVSCYLIDTGCKWRAILKGLRPGERSRDPLPAGPTLACLDTSAATRAGVSASTPDANVHGASGVPE
jgi:hypothetical protein